MPVSNIFKSLGFGSRKEKVDALLSSLDATVELLNATVKDYRFALQHIETEMIDHFGHLTPEGQRAMTIARRMLDVIEQRLAILAKHTFFNSLHELRQTEELARRPIGIDDNCVTRLCTEGELPMVEVSELRGHLDDLFNKMVITHRQQIFS